MMKFLFPLLAGLALTVVAGQLSAQGPWGPGAYPPPPGYHSAPPAYGAPYGGPPPGYYGNPYRGAYPPPPRRNRWSRNFFGFPGGRNNDYYDDGPWDMRTFTDPERFWDDMLATPDYMPTMPGGWNVPSVSVPNPVEVGREIADQSPEMFDAARDISRDY